MTTANHHFSKPVEYTNDPAFDHAVRFAVDRRDAALMPVLRARTPGVKTVTDEPLSNWEQVFASAATSVLSGVPGVPSVMLRGAYARGALRPSSRGLGRGRDR